MWSEYGTLAYLGKKWSKIIALTKQKDRSPSFLCLLSFIVVFWAPPPQNRSEILNHEGKEEVKKDKQNFSGQRKAFKCHPQETLTYYLLAGHQSHARGTLPSHAETCVCDFQVRGFFHFPSFGNNICYSVLQNSWKLFKICFFPIWKTTTTPENVDLKGILLQKYQINLNL